MKQLFRKVLIANRGEIACRIMRTCRRLGIATVAVYSDADANARHVREADEAVRLGPAPAQQSYLSTEAILRAAQLTGAQAIHPGYGFLSENEHFAQVCLDAGITFIGPPANAIHAMGSKSAAKALMQQAGVPLTPGYHGEEQSPAFLQQQADAIGFPVLIKASAGGGGKGMRRVDSAADFAGALASCKREAASAFGDDHVLIERYILSPRHIEIQVFADTHGNVVSLFERDCSVQRRHQKVLEEAPAPGMSAERRAAMGKAACDAARSVGYTNAGTVEFIADQQGNFFFMEMNTRLQVEHPVTEMITGLDLVEWQLRVAAGEPLPLTQEQLQLRGHALEARLYAEDPAHDFLPSTGKLIHFHPPTPSTHVRLDSGVEQGDEITAFYDPMIAKLIVWGENREAALNQMRRALAQVQIVGVKTNVGFLQRLVASPSFTNAVLDTSLIERESAWLAESPHPEQQPHGCLLATLALLLQEQQDVPAAPSPWTIRDGLRLFSVLQRTVTFTYAGDLCEVHVDYAGDLFRLQHKGQTTVATGMLHADGLLRATLGEQQICATVVRVGDAFTVFSPEERWEGTWLDPHRIRTSADAEKSDLLSPMPGRVTALLVSPGEQVEKGMPLMVLEAMKMEYTVRAPARGRVKAFLYEAGDQVSESTQLLAFEADEAEGAMA